MMLKKLLALLLAFTLVGGVVVAQDAEPAKEEPAKEEPANKRKAAKRNVEKVLFIIGKVYRWYKNYNRKIPSCV